MDIRSFGYVGVKSPNAKAWENWGTEIMGFGVGDPIPEISALAKAVPKVDGAVYLRMDDRRWRFAVYPGERDELAFVGWELADRFAFNDALRNLDKIGVEYEIASEELALERGVQGMAFFYDPVGYRHEFFYSAYYMEDSFRPGRFPMKKGFRTEHGIGHIVLAVPHLTNELDDFAHYALGYRIYCGGTSIPNTTSDGTMARVRTELYRGPHNKLSHNFGYMEASGCFGLHHIFLEYHELDDLGRTYDLVQKKSEFPLVMTLGRHQADTTVSFYAQTPSKFLFEVGWNSKMMDDESFVQDRPLHSFAWGLNQVGSVLMDHMKLSNVNSPNPPPKGWSGKRAGVVQALKR